MTPLQCPTLSCPEPPTPAPPSTLVPSPSPPFRRRRGGRVPLRFAALTCAPPGPHGGVSPCDIFTWSNHVTFLLVADNSRNLLSTISLAGTNIDSRSYDAGGRLTSETLGNGLVVSRTYVNGDNLPLAISNTTVGTYTYNWDANKNKTGETITGGMSGYTSTMAFDDQNRLTSWNRSSGDSQAWTLSAVNDWQSFTKNGTAEARTHGPAHEVLTVGPAAIQHDSRGNMTVDEFAIARTYDADGKVSQAVVPAGSTRGNPGTHTYQYDALNRRVRKTTGGTNPSDTIFAHTGEQILADYPAGTAAASPTTKYAWGTYIDELVCQFTATGKLYPHRNQQYSTIAVTDQTGTVTERYAYTIYGDLLTLDPTTLAVRTTAPFTRYTYTGREYDPETGSYHFRARPYSASLGRFNAHDPIRYPDGYNTYAGWFALKKTDPTGKITKVFSRPTDDPGELVNGVPYETATITVTVTADISKCKCKCGLAVVNSGSADGWLLFPADQCSGTVAIKFEYSSTLKSSNGDDPAAAGGFYGIEVDNTGYLWDSFYPFTVTPPAGGGIVGTVVSGSATVNKSCDTNQGCSSSINQKYYIRSEIGAGPVNGWYELVDQSFDYSISVDCKSGTFSETLSGNMENPTANGPLREVPPDSSYPPSPHPGP